MCEADRSTHRMVLFSKYPEPGKVMTRLIPAIGPDAAAELQKSLLLRTLGELKKVATRKRIDIEMRYTGGAPEKFERLLGGDVRFVAQGEGDLGRRMKRSVSEAFDENIKRVVLVGSDIPELTANIVVEALDALETNDVAVGPAADGGYYLLGMRRRVPSIFEGMPWGTAAVLQLTKEKMSDLGIRFVCLKTLNDLDRPEDLARFNWEQTNSI